METSEQTLQSAAPNYEDCDNDVFFKLTEKDLLIDLKVLVKEYYCCTFSSDEKCLKIGFTNGQNFIITVKEYTQE